MENTNSINYADVPLPDKPRREEQKGCCKRNGGTIIILYLDQHILNESKMRRKNLTMATIDNKKAYKMVMDSSTLLQNE